MDESSTTLRPVRATRRKIRWVAAAIVLMLVVGGLLYWRDIQEVGHPAPPASSAVPAPPHPPGESAAVPDSAPVDVQVTKPTRRDLVYTVKLPANVSPLYQTTLYAKVSGYLKWIGPDKGDAVKKTTSSPSSTRRKSKSSTSRRCRITKLKG